MQKKVLSNFPQPVFSATICVRLCLIMCKKRSLCPTQRETLFVRHIAYANEAMLV